MDEILNYLRNCGVYFFDASSNMIMFGFNQSYICGSISFYSHPPLCRFFYFDGHKKYFKNFPFDKNTFDIEYTKAKSGYIYIKNKETDDILSVLD